MKVQRNFTVTLARAAMLFVGSIASAVAEDGAVAKPCPATAARVVLLHSGAVTLNGVAMQMDELGKAIAALQPHPGEVCVAQENAADQSPDLGSFVEGLIFLKIPVSIYTDGSFTTRALRIPKEDP